MSSDDRAWGGRFNETRFTHRTRIHNLRDVPVSVIVEGRIPVGENERIRVELAKSTTEGFKDSENRAGVKLWALELDSGEKREMELSYTVRHPREIYLANLR